MPELNKNTKLTYIDSLEDVRVFLDWATNDRGRTHVAIDTETGGLDFWNHELRLVQIGDLHHGFAMRWDRFGGLFTDFMNTFPGFIDIHNLQFDFRFLEREKAMNIPWDRVRDTLLAARILRPGQSADLKGLSEELIDPRGRIGQDMLKTAFKANKWDWDTVPYDYPGYTTYAALDTVETAWLAECLPAWDIYPEAWDIEMNALRICYQMEKRGFAVDVEYAEQQYDHFLGRAKRIIEWGSGKYGFNIASNTQLVAYALQVGIPLTKMTPKGQYQMTAEVIEDIVNDVRVPEEHRKLFGWVKQARDENKLATTYFRAIAQDHHDGRIHPSLNTMQAITGRMSSSRPNLQNLPSNSSAVKKAYIPDPGEVLLSSDLDQVEFRIFAHLSNDTNLINTFLETARTGGDIFTTIGKDVYNDPDFQKSDPRRKLIKGVTYGSLYGASVKKQALTAGVPVEEMQVVYDALTTQYPGWLTYPKSLMTEVEDRARMNNGIGWIEVPYSKRRIPVPGDTSYRGTNYTIQGLAADVLKRNLIKMDAAGISEFLRVPVHDEVILSVPTDLVEDVKRTVVDCMTTTEGFAVPLTSDCSDPILRWGDKYEDGH